MEHLYIIADTDSCDSLDSIVCASCPLAKLKRRADGSFMSCSDAVGFTKRGDGSYSKAATIAIIEHIIGDEDEKD